MPYFRIFLCILIFTYAGQSKAQEMDSYQWQNRMLLVKTNDLKCELFLSQLAELQSDKIGLKERKLLVFQVKGKYYREGVGHFGEWHKIDSKQLLVIANDRDAELEVLLVGLDGGIKLRRSKVLPREELFAIIDGMPMRRRELRNGEN